MSEYPSIANLDVDSLQEEEKSALDILRHLSVNKFNDIKEILNLGTPGVIGPETLQAFVGWIKQQGVDLTFNGVVAFKDSHRLGNAGNLKGVIGPQTAEYYYDEFCSPYRNIKMDRMLLSITGAFEGRGFTNLTGDFDDQGLSFGVLQWNFGQGSLNPLLHKMYDRDPAKFSEIFGEHTEKILSIIRSDKTVGMQFARSINDAKNNIIEPWKSRFIKLGSYKLFQEVQVEFAEQLINRAKKFCRQFGVKTQRGLALMFDIVVQNGSPPDYKDIHDRIQQAPGGKVTERELLVIIAVAISERCNPKWKEDVLSRKMCIAKGKGMVHGRNFDLDREYGLNDRPWGQ